MMIPPLSAAVNASFRLRGPGDCIAAAEREGLSLTKAGTAFMINRPLSEKKAAAWTDLMVDECMKAQNTVKNRILFVEEIW